MGCQSEVTLGQNLTFSFCTHDPDTGVSTDADTLPTWRLYEKETTTAILTGTASKLDDANTTGTYADTVACTAANGFETDTSYTIVITATVGGDTGRISFGFRCKTAVWSEPVRTLTVAVATATAATEGDFTMIRGDSIAQALTGLGDISNRTKLWFTMKSKKSHTDAQAICRIEETVGLEYLNAAAAGTAANGDITVQDETAGNVTIVLDEVESAKLVGAKRLYYDISVLRDTGAVNTIGTGEVEVQEDVGRVIV